MCVSHRHSVALYTSRWLLAAPDQLYSGGGLLVRDGRVAEVACGPSAVRRLAASSGEAPLDLGEALLVPGMIDAHAHLELSGLVGLLPRNAGFGAWVAHVVELRAAGTARRCDSGPVEVVRKAAYRHMTDGEVYDEYPTTMYTAHTTKLNPSRTRYAPEGTLGRRNSPRCDWK